MTAPVLAPQATVNPQNSAKLVGLDDELGAIEPGMLADLVLVEGNPLTDSDALLAVKVVIKNGQVVVDKR